MPFIYVVLIVFVVALIYVMIKADAFKNFGDIFDKFYKEKPEKKPKETKPAKEKTEQNQPEKAQETDRGFKVSKKGRIAKVNKKALDTDSRTTAKIEQVFERKPSSNTSEVIEVDQGLTQDHEELVSAVDKIQNEERKVVSVAELKKEQDELCIIQQEEQEKLRQQQLQAQQKPATERYAIGSDAGKVRGVYTGFGVGGNKDNNNDAKPDQQPTPKTVVAEDGQSIRDLFSRMEDPFGFPNFRGGMRTPEPPKDRELDMSDAVIAEAILNPKYKRKTKQERV